MIPPRHRALCLLSLACGMLCIRELPAGEGPQGEVLKNRPAPAAVDFNRDIRPILSNNCFYCHGPDEKQRKGGKDGLRLDTAEGQREDLGGCAAVTPGRPEASEIIKRIVTDDPDDHMPPQKSGKKISPGELDLLKQWIAGGAKFTRHWSYEKLARPVLPAISDFRFPISNPVDRFVLAKLGQLGLAPQAEADRHTLARRAALDLTGLPPPLEEADAFVNDRSAGAYERYVDRMLARESFGEHWARTWLDLARYADSAGYADDPPRSIWAYRDYVIRAFNRNVPFDQFTVEQIAGDLLPAATEEQVIATAFHRNTMTNSEGGTVDEEFRNAAIVDRVNTTMAVWMGTSMACAQCHSHKFDPITNKEYFQFFAFFNNTADADKRDESPVLELFNGQQKAKRARLDAEFAGLEKKFNSPAPELIAAAQNWARVFPAKLDSQTPGPSAVKTGSNAKPATLDDNRVLVPAGAKLPVPIQQPSKNEKHTPGGFRVGASSDASGPGHARTPAPVLAALNVDEEKRDDKQRALIVEHFVRKIAPQLAAERKRLAALERERNEIKPVTVPVCRELKGDQRRKTLVQLRGNYLVTTDEVAAAVPAAWHAVPRDGIRDRLTLARWLVDRNNPLTPRVIANRFWEQIFGIGIVRSSEEFGSQGEVPVNQELLDWLACELIDMNWDVKRFLRLLVTSSAYRQSSRVTPEVLEKDPENRFLSRGPRFRLSAEMVRDQALAASGLLSPKMYGPSVRPARPSLGLNAAFGGNLDWQTSGGDDAHRRAVYTEWRRTSPYPSMATFDAPSRESCTLRRTRTNTPLQALVTMNDPVFIEAAQALARRMAAGGGTVRDKVRAGFRACLTRVPSDAETARLARMHDEALAFYRADAAKARDMATNPIGAAPPGADMAGLAAWTTVANVLLNLDETLMKR